MKKKSKYFGRLMTMFVSVLCVCLLCVPAFASSVDDDSIVFPEKTFTESDYNDMEEAYIDESVSDILKAGNTYVVNFNGRNYTCVAGVIPVTGAVYLGNYEGQNPSFPFLIADGYGALSVIPYDGSSSFTLSIRLPAKSDSIFASITEFAASLRGQLSATSVIEVLAYIAGACVLGVFLWWGVRKAIKGINSAFLRGKFRL